MLLHAFVYFFVFGTTSRTFTHLHERANEIREKSRWQLRTEKRRQRTEDLLNAIEIGTSMSLFPMQPLQALNDLKIPILGVPQTSSIDWDEIDWIFDPIRGGKLPQGSQRGLRKRAQVEAIHYIVSELINAQLQSRTNLTNYDVTIIDAGCGAGNLAVSLAGLSYNDNVNVKVLAVDVNEHALSRLSNRIKDVLSPEQLETCHADLANYDYILTKIPPSHFIIIVSLHACGAASDMAMNLAIRNNSPFVICPCCTAKSLTKRLPDTDKKTMLDLNAASFQRSGASADIEYPRSKWLRRKMSGQNKLDEKYSLLAKVADAGLGTQTPSQIRQQQARAKKIVELDRLSAASEEHDYDVRLMRIRDHDPLVYSKGDLLIGGKDIAEMLVLLPEEEEK